MRFRMLRAFATVVAAVAAAGCGGDVPTAAVPPQGPSLNTGALGATVTCSYYYGTTYDCTAVASGGSGTGYSFYWAYGGEYYDQGGVSKAYVQCYRPSGSYHGTLSNYGSVTDSNGNTAWFSVSRSC